MTIIESGLTIIDAAKMLADNNAIGIRLPHWNIGLNLRVYDCQLAYFKDTRFNVYGLNYSSPYNPTIGDLTSQNWQVIQLV